MARQPWLRLYTAILDSQKIQFLPDKLFRALVNFWCIAKENDGRLPPDATCAWRLRVPESTVKRWVSDLETRGLIDHLESGDRVPHDWSEHQYETQGNAVSTERVRRFRERRNGYRNGKSVPFPSRDQSRAEQNPQTPNCETCGGKRALYAVSGGQPERWKPLTDYVETMPCPDCK